MQPLGRRFTIPGGAHQHIPANAPEDPQRRREDCALASFARAFEHGFTQRSSHLASPKYKLGQLVDFNPARATVPASIREYKILRLMPYEGGERQYRIKTIAELFERIAKESELTPRGMAEASL